MAADSQVELQNPQGLPAPSQDEFQHWVDTALQALNASEAALCIRVVGEQEAAQINHQYRDVNRATNVLAFPAPEPAGVLGDLVLCAPVLEREARAQGKALQHHWAHLCIHGLLHLHGYDHEQPEKAQVMEDMEREILTQLQIPDPYAG